MFSLIFLYCLRKIVIYAIQSLEHEKRVLVSFYKIGERKTPTVGEKKSEKLSCCNWANKSKARFRWHSAIETSLLVFILLSILFLLWIIQEPPEFLPYPFLYLAFFLPKPRLCLIQFSCRFRCLVPCQFQCLVPCL